MSNITRCDCGMSGCNGNNSIHDLRLKGQADQAAARREADLQERETVLRERSIASRERWQDGSDAVGEDAPADVADWEAFDRARMVIEVDPNRVTLPAIMERTDLRTILYAETVNYISSRPNGGKTWLAIKGMVQGSTLGGRFVILDYDMKRPDTLARRALAMGCSDLFKDASKFYFVDLEQWTANPGIRAAAAEFLLAAPNPVYSAVVIDTDTSAGAANDGGDIREWWALHIAPWEKRQIGVMILAHLPKADKKDEATHGPMGSQDKRGKLSGASYRLETIVGFNEDQGGLVQMVVDKDKHGQLPAVEGDVAADVVFTWIGEKGDPDRWINITIEPHDEHREVAQHAGNLTEQLYEALVEFPDGIYSQKSVNKLVKGGGKALGESLQFLLNSGRVVGIPVEGKRGHIYKVDLYCG